MGHLSERIHLTSNGIKGKWHDGFSTGPLLGVKYNSEGMMTVCARGGVVVDCGGGVVIVTNGRSVRLRKQSGKRGGVCTGNRDKWGRGRVGCGCNRGKRGLGSWGEINGILEVAGAIVTYEVVEVVKATAANEAVKVAKAIATNGVVKMAGAIVTNGAVGVADTITTNGTEEVAEATATKIE